MLIGTFMSHVQHCMQLCFPYVHTHNTYTKHAGRWQSAPQRTEFKVVELLQQVLLGTMTVICRSVPLLLLIALATTTLGAHPVKGDASEGESTNTGGCISDWRGMKEAYLQRQSSTDVENSIFDFYPSDALNYSVLVMFYDVGLPPNTSTSGRRECCQWGSTPSGLHHSLHLQVHSLQRPPSTSVVKSCWQEIH